MWFLRVDEPRLLVSYLRPIRSPRDYEGSPVPSGAAGACCRELRSNLQSYVNEYISNERESNRRHTELAASNDDNVLRSFADGHSTSALSDKIEWATNAGSNH